MTLPWQGTTPEISAEDDSRYETPGGAQEKVDISQDYLLHLLKLAVTGLSNGSEAAIARYSTPYNITYDWLKDRLDAGDMRTINAELIAISATNPPPPLLAATFDGVTDDTLKMQAIINYVESKGGGTIELPANRVSKITNTLLVSKPIHFIGQGYGNDFNNPNGSGTGVTTFRWSGNLAKEMFWFKSKTANNYLFGGGLENVLLDGNNVASVGIRASSTGYQRFINYEVRQVTQHGTLIDNDNGVLSQFNIIEGYHFVYGVNVAVEGANGLTIVGLSTQNHIISIAGLVKNGKLIYLGLSDNNTFEKISGVVIGTGYVVYFANEFEAGAYNNVIKYMSGNIHAESATFGNRIMHLTSEGNTITCDPGAQLHYEVVDYFTSEHYKTHFYKMNDQYSISAGSFVIDKKVIVGASEGLAASQWSCIDFAKGVAGRASLTIRNENLDKGIINKVRVYFTTDTANTSAAWDCLVRLNTVPFNNVLTMPGTEVRVSAVVADAQNVLRYVDVTVNRTFNRDDHILLSIIRDVSAADTALGVVQMLSCELHYTSNGPDSAGSGTYAVTLPYRAGV